MAISKMFRYVAAAVLVLCSAVEASAARRMALVIGIDQYQYIPKLQKAVGDADAMASTLKRLGFDVTKVVNADRRTLNIAIADFKARLSRDDIALIHYSGHGIAIDGQNYLLPADIPKPQSGRKDLVTYEAIALNRLVDQLAASGARTRLLVIDACRDNPFAQAGVRSVGSTRGLARTDAPAGTFIMYSAGYRQRALDRLGDDDQATTSVYTRTLITELQKPGKSISKIARDVRGKVEQLASSIGHVQRPAYYDELSDQLVLLPGEQLQTSPAPAQPAQPAQSDRDFELAYWNSVKDTGNPDLLKAYLKQYPGGAFASLARTMLERRPAGADEADEKPPTSKERISSVQAELARRNCNPGPVDGIWGNGSRRAAAAFIKAAGLSLQPVPNEALLQALKQAKDAVCPRVAVVKPAIKPARKQPAKPARTTTKKQSQPRKKSDNCGICQNLRVCGSRYRDAQAEGLCF
ncbi:MAG: caspase family protein [Hyphomicrobiales bacterium]|nr:caspase family protein [Hyphomicrobiales bacterium]